MKNCKRRTVFSWIFAFILLIPMFSIAVRCLYVVVNKNAYQSYSDYTIQDTLPVTTTNNLLIENRDYIWSFNGNFTNNSDYIYFNDISDNIKALQPNQTLVAFRLTGNANLVLRDNNNQDYTRFNYFTSDGAIKTFDFNYASTSQPTNLINNGKLYLINYTKGTIDDVFEYSIQQFVDKHGNGLINFFGLLEQYFMQSTTANALYFTFANWCLNYVLLVSCVWLLFSVLMWFINYCNYMLNTSFRKGHGD